MTIHLATDHAGFEYKEVVSAWLSARGYRVIDHGATAYDEDDDFPDYIAKAAAAVGRRPHTTRGIIFGGSGQGEAIVANRYPGVRAIVYYGENKSIPSLSRQHNDANIISIGVRFVSIKEVEQALDGWLNTMPLNDKKYARRNKKIEKLARSIAAQKYRPVVPAVIPQSAGELIAAAEELSFSDELQVDLVDGEFVNSVSWPYSPLGDPAEVAGALSRYDLELDLMVKNPTAAAKAWEAAGAERIIFHIETLSLRELKKYVKNTTCLIGVSAHGDTSLETIIEYAEQAHYVQLMGINQIGAQGLPFDETVLDKIKALKERFPMKLISIDGSVNSDTITRLAAAGADRFAVGSAIVKQTNKQAAHKTLSDLVNA